MRGREEIKKQVIENLQTLRAFAAINVIVFHVISISSSYGMPTEHLLFLQGWGASGVDIFFVISGFVMLHTQMRKKRNVATFYASRIIRIVPIYWFVTSVFVALVFIPGVYRELTVTPGWVVSSYFFVSQPVTGAFPLNGVGWTLEWEMLFYLVFGASLVFRSWKASVVFTFVALCVVSYVSGHLLVFEFFGGMVIAGIYNFRKFGPLLGGGVFLGGVMLLLLSLYEGMTMWDMREAGLDRFFVWGIPAFLIVFGCIASPQISSPKTQFLGDASYSIYLVQSLSVPGFYRLVGMWPIEVNYDVLAVICLAVSVFGGVVMHLLIERPMNRALRRTASPPVLT